MSDLLKKSFYFPVASYFRFFAQIRLKLWRPTVVVVTGSNGKTTLLHLLEAQLGQEAKFSHHANSSFGIPFDILDLHRKTLHPSEWFSLFLRAPFSFIRIPKQKLYIVEADADRPGEGKFLAQLLRPDIVLWVSTGTTHSMNFDPLVKEGKFKTVEEAIAYEYGYFLAYAKKLVILDNTSDLEKQQKQRATVEVQTVERNELQKYTVDEKGTHYVFENVAYSFPSLLPEAFYVSLGMCIKAIDALGMKIDAKFKKFVMPPGRGTVLSGIKKTVLIDSSYNANRNSIAVMLKMFEKTPFKKKWVVLGDMLELGNEEKREHEALAEQLLQLPFERIVLVGKISKKYITPILQKQKNVVGYESAQEALAYLQKNIKGGEAILFKGSQSIFLEGIIENLLEKKSDASRLPRRDVYWQMRRKGLGL